MPRLIARSEPGKWVEFGVIGLGAIYALYHINLSNLASGKSMLDSLATVFKSGYAKGKQPPGTGSLGAQSNTGAPTVTPQTVGSGASILPANAVYGAGDTSATGLVGDTLTAQDAANAAAQNAGYWSTTPGGQPQQISSGYPTQ